MAEIYVDKVKIDIPTEGEVTMNMIVMVKLTDEEKANFALLPTKKEPKKVRFWQRWLQYWQDESSGRRSILKDLGWTPEEIDREMDLRERQKRLVEERNNESNAACRSL